ncbi:MAG TPA: DUF4345 family protein [Hyphomonas sp.]|nr:DUF4345 family protein [Hyphomonas sp.]MCA8904766.1 DUF4345 family protein [Hyphomonas sp.]HPE48535.1 DUF4345 family protein [Hyphomonas sp.]
MMAAQVFRFGLRALGIAAMLIGAMMFLLGPAATGHAFAVLLDAVARTGTDLAGLAAANTDSELRFYAVFWFVYGIFALRVARRLPDSIGQARLLLGLFLLGGVGRVLSLGAAGTPHPLFVVLMGTELVLPVALIGISFFNSVTTPRRSPQPDTADRAL